MKNRDLASIDSEPLGHRILMNTAYEPYIYISGDTSTAGDVPSMVSLDSIIKHLCIMGNHRKHIGDMIYPPAIKHGNGKSPTV